MNSFTVSNHSIELHYGSKHSKTSKTPQCASLPHCSFAGKKLFATAKELLSQNYMSFPPQHDIH